MLENPSQRSSLNHGKTATLTSFDILLITKSDNPIVNRGIKAVAMVYQLTNRVPDLIQQSHLERTEGRSAGAVRSVHELTYISLDDLLVTNIPHAQYAMRQPLQRNTASSFLMSPALSPLPPIGVFGSSRVDRHLWRSLISSEPPTS